MNIVLAAVDGSQRSPLVLKEAAAVARAHGSRVRVLHVVSLPPDLPSNIWGAPERAVEQLIAEGRRTIDELAKDVTPALLETTTVEVGVPWRAICDAAKDPSVELVVMGAHGYGLLERMIGTTAAKVVNHVSQNVMIVRPKGEARP